LRLILRFERADDLFAEVLRVWLHGMTLLESIGTSKGNPL
jgi:hypothetical protein